ncbi:UDP-N-acetylmuramoyl-tripeptide--D-alanyl-D-alanine ligase [Xinfangfangia sp. CPCC 101601]|uniref:UDP-N-acetylmuramoyl-tripeptide--D-alanyl-D-alanine ligase n=1 Tax=Pseudogemmobacter lacusdianii TaxID=3069608 RepID=A0ABU0VX48_9RHOB|nr:UDP-N-acetylmuramoyl-tripeptide--D-alanyl-D-alanine ligase [Xinfangfangia sp. CPCC 101601]MDQ2066188.1 UDP-N-acetylmuramoyl-tripeptide--D-alanyl-D-alanine ligase [Xinfangfangia sp. CPCC 101601]
MARFSISDIVELLPDGRWIVPPSEPLLFTGVSTYLPSWRPDDITFLRRDRETFGISARALRESGTVPRLLITSGPELGLPETAVLQVPDRQRALMKLARAARARLPAPLIGVTGSAGKTSTTALIAHALGQLGPVYASRVGANTARGVAWNLASAREEDRHIVLEMAIAGMRDSTAAARPDVAVFTNIHAAHLVHHGDLRTIAARKSRMFEGMRPGGKVILNSSMSERDYVAELAHAKGLEVIFYGRRPEDHVRPTGYDPERDLVRIAIGEALIDLPKCNRHGVHMLHNFLAACGVHLALGLSLDHLAAAFASFAPLPGRGARYAVPHPGGLFTLLDHSYNANPASMRVALAELLAVPVEGRRIAVLGEMAELGETAAAEHHRLMQDIAKVGLDRIYTIGAAYQRQGSVPGHQELRGPEDLAQIFENEIAAGDVVMVKGSNSTGLNAWVSKYIKDRSASLN